MSSHVGDTLQAESLERPRRGPVALASPPPPPPPPPPAPKFVSLPEFLDFKLFGHHLGGNQKVWTFWTI